MWMWSLPISRIVMLPDRQPLPKIFVVIFLLVMLWAVVAALWPKVQ